MKNIKRTLASAFILPASLTMAQVSTSPEMEFSEKLVATYCAPERMHLFNAQKECLQVNAKQTLEFSKGFHDSLFTAVNITPDVRRYHDMAKAWDKKQKKKNVIMMPGPCGTSAVFAVTSLWTPFSLRGHRLNFHRKPDMVR